METQLFENKNASTEIIGPVVLYLKGGICTGKSLAMLVPNVT